LEIKRVHDLLSRDTNVQCIDTLIKNKMNYRKHTCDFIDEYNKITNDKIKKTIIDTYNVKLTSYKDQLSNIVNSITSENDTNQKYQLIIKQETQNSILNNATKKEKVPFDNSITTEVESIMKIYNDNYKKINTIDPKSNLTKNTEYDPTKSIKYGFRIYFSDIAELTLMKGYPIPIYDSVVDDKFVLIYQNPVSDLK